MAYSNRTYPGTGAQTDFTVDFPYLAQAHVGVTVNGVSTAFTWVNSSTIRISPAPANGTSVRIGRDSNRAARLTSYANLSVLNEDALNFDAKQLFYVAQEAFDAVAEAPSGGDLRAVNNLSEVNPAAARANIQALPVVNPVVSGSLTLPGDPTLPLHAASKAWVEALIAAIPGGSGEVNAGLNVGSGGVTANIYKDKSGLNLRFRKLVQGANITLTESADTIQIDATGGGGSGEVNIGANVAVTGEPLYTGKTGVALQFKGVGPANASLSKVVSGQDVLFKINESDPRTWAAKHRYNTDIVGPDDALDFTMKMNHVFGSAKQIQSAMFVQGRSLPGAGAGALPWVVFAQLEHFSDNVAAGPIPGADGVAGYFRTYRRGVAPAWAIVGQTVSSSANKSQSVFGAEFSVEGDGTYTSSFSGPLGLFYGPVTRGAGTACRFDHGILMGQIDSEPNAVLTYGVRMEGKIDYGIGFGAAGVSAIVTNGDYSGPAIDTAGNVNASCGIRIRAGQAVRMSGASGTTRDMVLNTVGLGAMEFQYNGNTGFEIPIYDRSGTSSTQYAMGLRTGGYANFIKSSVAGGPSATANPAGYIRIKIDGNFYRLAFYND